MSDETFTFSPATYRQNLKQIISIVKPWRINHDDSEYARGWNECVKKSADSAKRLMKMIDEHIEAYEKSRRGE